MINAQCYFDWYAVTRLVHLGAPLESRSPQGDTPLLHCAGSGSTPNVIQLFIQHGADMNATSERDGDSMWHRLIRRPNARVLSALADDGTFLRCIGMWHQPNHAGVTPMQLAETRKDLTTDTKSVYRLMLAATTQWSQLLAPMVEKELTLALGIGDLAAMVMQYIDGSGAKWESDSPFESPSQDYKPPSVDPSAPVSASQSSLALAAAQPINPAAPGEWSDDDDGHDEEEDDEEDIEPNSDMEENENDEGENDEHVGFVLDQADDNGDDDDPNELDEFQEVN